MIDHFLLKKEIKIKNYTENNLWNVTEYNEDDGEITLFFFPTKKERDEFLREDQT